MARFTTAVPTGGLAASVGATVLYVPTIGPTAGTATLYYKYGATDVEWCTLAAGATGGAEPTTADPRTSGLARAVGATCLYVVANVGTLLYKHGATSTDWCTWSPASTVYQPLDSDLTALAASAATAGLVERTGAAAYATRLIGVANATDIPTRADADARYAPIAAGVTPRRVVGATFDGSGSAPTAGSVGYAVVPFNGTIDQWHIVADVAGSAVVDVWKAAGAIPTDANRIAGTEKPTLAAAQLGSDTNLTAWSTLAVAAGDVFGFELEAAATCTRVTVEVRITESD